MAHWTWHESHGRPDIQQPQQSQNSKPEDNKTQLPVTQSENPPNEIAQLDNLSLNSLYKKPLEDSITQWRNELDYQNRKMTQLTDIYRDFEGKLLNNFDSILSMSVYHQKLQHESDSSLLKLKDINAEEDQIIEQLTFMDKTLTKNLEESERFYNPYDQDKETQLYNNISKVSKDVDEIGKEIEKANAKVEIKESNSDSKDQYGFNYENELFKEKVFIDKNKMNDILNSFYIAVRSIKMMEGTLTQKLQQVESEIAEKKKQTQMMNGNYNMY